LTNIGKAQKRFEDELLLRGKGSYTNDLIAEKTAWMVLVRSPFASAEIKSIQLSKAKKAKGVLGIYTREDLDKDNVGIFKTLFKFKRPDGEEMFKTPFGLLAKKEVRFVGDPVVAVVAETQHQAEDAAELISIDFEEKQALTNAKEAINAQPLVWEEVPGNTAFRVEKGNKIDTEEYFEIAKHVVELDLKISRVTANPIEPRNAIGYFDSSNNNYTLTVGTQTPHRLKNIFSEDILKIDPKNLIVTSPDIGGAFGMKNNPYPEYGLLLWISKKIDRKIAWLASRVESMQSDFQGRDNFIKCYLALDENYKFLSIKVKSICNLGAYLGPLTPHPPTANIGGIIGPYGIKSAYAEILGVHTHTPPTAPYRGAGRPEATYIIERLVERAASKLKLDPIKLRKENFLSPKDFPYTTPLGMTYDCGDFETVLDQCTNLSDWHGFEKRKKESQLNGFLRGRGLAYAIEIAGGPQGAHTPETVSITFNKINSIDVLVGSKEMGTGHGTAFRQILSDSLGVSMDLINISDGDTSKLTEGTGSFGSRTMVVATTALKHASAKIIENGKHLASNFLETTIEDIEFQNGLFRVVGTDHAISLMEIASKTNGEMDCEISKKADGPTYPNGCHICEIEIDCETGECKLVSYTLVDDIGNIINPLIVKGQLQGGIAQGAGQALMEQIEFDNSGQLLTGTFLDYAMPRADNLPFFRLKTHSVPTKLNPLGVKGAGEAGTVGALAAVVNAALDALKPIGVNHIDMPLTPENIWKAISKSKQ